MSADWFVTQISRPQAPVQLFCLPVERLAEVVAQVCADLAAPVPVSGPRPALSRRSGR